MIPIIAFTAAALVVCWFVGEFKVGRPLRIGLGFLALAAATYAGYRSGRLAGQLEYFWVPKANALLTDSMSRIESLVVEGHTNVVANAAAAFGKASRTSTNEFGHYRAIMELWDALQDKE